MDIVLIEEVLIPLYFCSYKLFPHNSVLLCDLSQDLVLAIIYVLLGLTRACAIDALVHVDFAVCDAHGKNRGWPTGADATPMKLPVKSSLVCLLLGFQVQLQVVQHHCIRAELFLQEPNFLARHWATHQCKIDDIIPKTVACQRQR